MAAPSAHLHIWQASSRKSAWVVTLNHTVNNNLTHFAIAETDVTTVYTAQTGGTISKRIFRTINNVNKYGKGVMCVI